MFYIDKGELYITPSARLLPCIKRLEKEYSGGALRDICYYLRFQYIKRDNRDYYGMPPLERSRHIVHSFKLFGVTEKHKDLQVDEIVRGVEGAEAVSDVIKYILATVKTDKGRVVEDMRRKVEQLRKKYNDATEDKELQSTYKSLTQAIELMEMAQAMDGEEESLVVEYLFEYPEDVKPYALRVE